MKNFDKMINYGPLSLAKLMADEAFPHVLELYSAKGFKRNDNERSSLYRSMVETYYKYLVRTEDKTYFGLRMTTFENLIQSGPSAVARFIANEIAEHALDDFHANGIYMSADHEADFRRDMVEKYSRFLMRDEEVELFEKMKRELAREREEIRRQNDRREKMLRTGELVRRSGSVENEDDHVWVHTDITGMCRTVLSERPSWIPKGAAW